MSLHKKLYAACEAGKIEGIGEMLDSGADVNWVNSKNNGSTPLIRACEKGHHEVAALLLDRGAKVDLANKDGNTPLIRACMHCHREVAALLLNRGAKVDLANKDEKTQLSYIMKQAGDTQGAGIARLKATMSSNFSEVETQDGTTRLELIVDVIRAKGLKNSDTDGVSDPYCFVRMGCRGDQHVFRTKTCEADLNPVWDQAFQTVLHSPNGDFNHYSAEFKVFDEDPLTPDDFLGSVTLNINDLMDAAELEKPLNFSNFATETWVSEGWHSLDESEHSNRHFHTHTRRALNPPNTVKGILASSATASVAPDSTETRTADRVCTRVGREDSGYGKIYIKFSFLKRGLDPKQQHRLAIMQNDRLTEKKKMHLNEPSLVSELNSKDSISMPDTSSARVLSNSTRSASGREGVRGIRGKQGGSNLGFVDEDTEEKATSNVEHLEQRMAALESMLGKVIENQKVILEKS